MALRIIGTIPEGTCYPAELQDLVELLAPVLDAAGTSGGGAKELYIQSGQPSGIPEETAWFNPVTRILKFYGREPGDTEPSWFDLSLPDGIITTAMLADGAVTLVKLSADVQGMLGAVSASAANAVLGLPEQQGGGSYRANFFIMADGTVRASGVSKVPVSAVDRYKNGTGYVTASDASTLPKRVGFSPPLAGDTVSKVYLSRAATFVVTAAGAVYSTGLNATGQLGLGDTTDRTIFNKITQSNFNDEVVLQLAIGTGNEFLSCYALTAAGKVYVWGHNYYGQLGLGGTTVGNTNQPNVPTYVSALGTDNAEIVSAGAGSVAGATCKVSAYVRKTGGTVYGCGWNGDGQLGQGNTTASSSFIQLSALSGITIVRASGDGDHITFYAAELDTGTGSVWACGYNNKGQVGNGNTTNATSPNESLNVPGVAVTDLFPFATNTNFSVLVLMADGTLRAWGSNANKQLALGSGAGTTNVTSPATPTVQDLDSNALDVTQIRLGGSGGKMSSAILALKDGTTTNEVWVMTAGGNTYGQLGLGNVTETPDFTIALIDTFEVAELGFGTNNANATLGQINLLVRLTNGASLGCGYDAASIGQLGVDASPASISILAYQNY